MKRVAIILLSIAAAAAADKDKDKARFSPGAASAYPTHQTMEKITIAAVPFTSEEQAQAAFGKVNPYKYGVLPVLVIIENNTGKALRLDLTAEYIDADNRHVEAIPAADVPYLEGPRRPRMPGTTPSPVPYPLPRASGKKKKGPLDTWEIEGRAFLARMLPGGESAHGFFYFQTPHSPGARLYLSGIREAASGKEFFYFEIPLDKP